jgi:hypothetical protein
MTGYTVHTGTSKKFASGWDSIFSGKAPAKKTAGKPAKGKKAATPKAKKQGTKKSAGRKKSS